MRYESEILYDLMKRDGLLNPPQNKLPYESELKEKYLNDVAGAYPKLNDYRSEWLNYALEDGVGEFPYVTLTDVTNATIDNVVPYAYRSAILKGNTIINLVNNFTFGTGVEETDNYFTLTQTNTAENIVVNIETSLIKLNNDYTLIYFIQEKTTTNATSLVIKQASCLAPSGNVTITQNIGWNKIKFNVSSFGSNRGLNIAIASSEQDGNYIKFAKNKFALLAGDWTQKELPFDTINYGMQSVKLPVLTTTGKNLYKNEGGEINKEINTNTGVVEKGNRFIPNAYTRVFSGETYTLYRKNVKMNMGIRCYDADKNFINSYRPYTNKNTLVFTVPFNCCYVRFIDEYNGLNNEYAIYLGDHSSNFEYEPHQSIILSTPSDLELRGIGDVKDTLDCLTGEVTQRIGKMVLNGTQSSIEYSSQYSNDDYYCFIYDITKNGIEKAPSAPIAISCPIPFQQNKMFPWTTAKEFVLIGSDGNTLLVKLLKSKLNNDNSISSLNTYLASNPITINYPLKTESIKTVDLMITNQSGESLSKITPIEGTMHLITSSDTIPPLFNGEIPVEAIEQNLASFADLEGVEHDG